MHRTGIGSSTEQEHPLTDSYRFSCHDRVRIEGSTYRPVTKINDTHVLELIVDNVVASQHHTRLTDAKIKDHFLNRRIRVDRDYYSKAGQLLRARGDDSDLSDLSDQELRTVAWKVEWCVRFERARNGLDDQAIRPRMTPGDLAAFIERERENIHRWYLRTFGEVRPAGRLIAGEARKMYDYPGPSTLREWLSKFAADAYQKRAFRPRYDRCGNRNQLDPRVVAILDKQVPKFASRAKPEVSAIYLGVQSEIDKANARLSEEAKLYVSERAVRRRIRRLTPLFIHLGRKGPDETRRQFTGVGAGLVTLDGLTELSRMERVEMDDWTIDLFAVLTSKHVWRRLDPHNRRKLKQLREQKLTTRCTITVAIEVVTKCIVGLHVSPFGPAVPGSKAALRTIVADKTLLAKQAGALSDWPMLAKPYEIATDGGPAFEGEFADAIVKLGIEHRLPGPDPRTRGTIESFFRSFKRLCRMFTGQAFSNVVEKGDYKSEELASVIVDELLPLIVRFIVDDYHHRVHSSLGMRPYTAWQQASNQMDPPPDHVQQQIAFGIPLRKRKISASGVRYLHADYVHPQMALLHGLVGRRDLTIVVDPHDMGSILVRLPQDVRDKLSGHGEYLTFDAPDLEGVSVAEHLRSNEAFLAFAAEEELQGRPFRLGAYRALMSASEDIRRRAGVPSDELTWAQYDEFVAAMERRTAQAVLPRAAPSGKATNADDGPDGLGIAVATPKGGRPSGLQRSASTKAGPRASTLDTSINLTSDEDDE